MKFAIIITLCLYLLINSAIIREPSIQYYSFKTQKHITHLSMYKERHSYIITNSTPKNSIAEVTYINDIETFGWGKLNVHTYNKSDEYTQSYCAGYLEGIVTYQEISNFYYNLYNNYHKESKLIDKIIAFLELVSKELLSKLSQITKDTSFYEYQLYLSFQQLVGLYHGYNSMSKDNKLSIGKLLLIQSDSEIPELLNYFKYHKKELIQLGDKNYFKRAFGLKSNNPNKAWIKLISHSRCSAFIKLVTDNQNRVTDLLSGHTTWSSYSELIRIYKHYSFNNNTTSLIFSSYPGVLTSTDDFIISKNKLVIMETTIEVIDINLYKQMKLEYKNYVPNFMRVLLASKNAKNNKEWITLFRKNMSGTYSSQWMILDYKIFNKIKGKTLNKVKQYKNLFQLTEEIPNKIISHDISNVLYNKKYFGSYNRAFLNSSKKTLNQQLIEHLYGNKFSYNDGNRALIFKHFNRKIRTLKQMNDLLRYNGYKGNNDWKEDPSKKSPSKGISARFDLEKGYLYELSGGVDTKVTNSSLVNQMGSVVVLGPTQGNINQLKAFTWRKNKDKVYHKGVPKKLSFPHLMMSPHTINGKSQKYVFK